MRKTFVCDDAMIINIPIEKDNEGRGHAMPRDFHCVFRDTFKVFAYNGFPRPLGAAQGLAGVSLVSLGLIAQRYADMLLICPSILFVVCGMLTYAAGRVPNMRVLPVVCCVNLSVCDQPPLVSRGYFTRAQTANRNQCNGCGPLCGGKLDCRISDLLAEQSSVQTTFQHAAYCSAEPGGLTG
ncbi:uncharacterized protein LOC144058027 isoform X2 [Vanacampus margaritifer]